MKSTRPSNVRPGNATKVALARSPGTIAPRSSPFLGYQPHLGKIRRLVERLAGIHPHTFLHRLIDDDTISLSHDGDAPGGTAGPAQPCDFFCRDIECAQALLRRRADGAAHAGSNQILFLGRDHVGRVNFCQDLAALDRVTGRGHGEVLKPAGYSCRDGHQAPLVKLKGSGCANAARARRTHLCRFSPDAQSLQAAGRDLDSTGRVALSTLVGIYGKVIHAHRVLFGLGRGVRQPHGVAVVEYTVIVAAPRLGGFGHSRNGLGSGTVLEHGLVVPPVSRLLRTACVEWLAVRLLVEQRLAGSIISAGKADKGHANQHQPQKEAPHQRSPPTKRSMAANSTCSSSCV
jgi:hypothetical protein